MWSGAAGPPCPGRPRPAPAAKQAVCISSVSCGPPSIKDLQRVPPFLRFDAQEVVLLPRFEEWDALGHLGVADHDAGLGLGERTRRVERPDEGVDVVAVHALDVPAERREARSSGSNPVTSGEGPSACWLLTSTMPIRLSSFR